MSEENKTNCFSLNLTKKLKKMSDILIRKGGYTSVAELARELIRKEYNKNNDK